MGVVKAVFLQLSLFYTGVKLGLWHILWMLEIEVLRRQKK
jgi:hypothetical protein